MKQITILFFTAFIIGIFGCASAMGADSIEKQTIERTDHPVAFTGLRSSSYGVKPFPSPEKWETAFDKMQSYFPESTPAGIWIVGNVNNSSCALQFPKPSGTDYSFEYMQFSNSDKHERFLSYFDEVGIKVFLQVEPGAADIDTLIKIIMDRYGHHESVIGFGVDLEWYSPNKKRGMNGVDHFSALSDEDAMRWDKTMKEYNPNYRMFLKHWVHNDTIMPQNTTSDIIFISDSQMFMDYAPKGPNQRQDALDAMVREFTNGWDDEDDSDGWAENFRRNDNVRSVGYQIGYESDRKIWKDLFNKPYAQNLCNAILQGIPDEQEVSFFWVDFTMKEVFFRD